ncbi:cytochrome-450 hydroxylase [Thelephora terrestris]|uniref:Cytochrome-450 hydroxylase n=1 Tax=Thelephora terrestris TaxID=56493 RepID=A0A9P6HS18_9AGAM|nr:cytochrome-450 hydroxylase [Thelephora terrestris]
MLPEILTTFVALCGGTLALCFYQFSIVPRRNPLWTMCGPPRRSIFHSHLGLVLDAGAYKSYELLAERYGRSVKVQGIGPWDQRLLTFDPVALNHVTRNYNIYEKPWQSRRFISGLIGHGLLSVEGAAHKRQRRAATPAFSIQNLRAFAPIVFERGFSLKNRWRDIIGNGDGDEAVLDVYTWVSRATFDVIGEAGFDYKFNSIEDDTNELLRAYKEMFELAVSQNKDMVRQMLGIYFPIIDVLFPDLAAKTVKRCHKVIRRVAGTLVQEKKKKILDAVRSGKHCADKDLLALMLKSNLSTDTPPDQRLSDDEILNNVNTFMFAGSDTSSLALAWALWLLANNPEVQDRLREEVSTIPCQESFEDLSVDEIDSLYDSISELPYLDKIIKESLRLVPPIHSSLRVAGQDDVIPTSQPYKIQKPGEDPIMVTSPIRVAKGTMVFVPLEGFNLDKSVWGPDAWEFKPDRWDDLPDAVNAQPGMYSHMMTFSAGPRSCIGMKFSVNEIKIILHILITNFSFHDTGADIIKSNVIFTRPFIKDKYEEGSQLPLRVVRLDS